MCCTAPLPTSKTCQMIKSLAKIALLKAGLFDVLPPRTSTQAMRVLSRTSRLCSHVGTVIDVGASDGRWTTGARRFFPDASRLLVEALPAHQEALSKLSRRMPRTYVEFAAASDADGEVGFTTSTDTFSNGVAQGPGSQIVRSVTLGSAVRRHNLSGPYVIKLDTHGHERQILQGATALLPDTALLIVETYNLPSAAQVHFLDFCMWLRAMQFEVAGVATALARRDGMLWQMDFHFLPASHAVFLDRKWS
jgi:FkbM family methyltransferase